MESQQIERAKGDAVARGRGGRGAGRGGAPTGGRGRGVLASLLAAGEEDKTNVVRVTAENTRQPPVTALKSSGAATGKGKGAAASPLGLRKVERSSDSSLPGKATTNNKTDDEPLKEPPEEEPKPRAPRPSNKKEPRPKPTDAAAAANATVGVSP